MKTIASFFPAFLSSILLAFITDNVFAETIHVPSDQPTIQAGIDASANGDTVLVADGIYTGDGNRDIDFKGKAITVRSENGYEHCIVDCAGSEGDFHQGFIFCHDEKRNSVLEGFTIKNGYLNETVCMDEFGNGGGILACSSPTIRNNRICNNRASFGAGIFGGDSALIENNIITENHSTRWGGGILAGSKDMIISNIITGNTAEDEGGGIWYRHGYLPQVINNIIADNHTNGQGGGIALSASANVVIIGNLIKDNSADLEGGGMYLDVATWNGSSLSICNNSILNNTASNGGGIYNSSASDFITNCLIWGNTPNNAVNCYLTYCCTEQKYAGEGNISDDPLLDDIDTLVTSLEISSPCVNAGKPDFADPNLPDVDYLHNSRIADGRIDIGAFEITDQSNSTIHTNYQMFYVYPVPAANFLAINPGNIEGDIISYRLLDNYGRVVLQDEYTVGKTIDISSLPKGIYYLQIKSNREVISKQVIII